MHPLVAGEAHHRSDTLHSHIGVSKGKATYLINGIDRQSRAGMRVAFDFTGYLEGGHAYLLIWALYSVLEQWDLSLLTCWRLNAPKPL
jgi:hypothetical protein